MDMSHKRVERWLGILCIIIFIALIGTNGAWLYYESQFEDVTTTISQETSSEGGGNAIVNDGVHYYGKGETDDNN